MGMLPAQFSELEPYAPTWALPTVTERYQARLDSDMEAMTAFYDAMVARADEAITYLDGFELDDFTDEQLHLLWMLCSLSAVGFAVDCFKQPAVPDTGAARLDFESAPVP